MAKRGASSRLPGPGRRDAEGTRRRLVDAAIASLRAVGFAGASAREIAGRAGCNQALVFYHFGSVSGLLLAALDETSRVRMDRYSAAVDGVTSPGELLRVGLEVFREDLEAGHITVLAELIAGASSTPGLGAEVAARVGTWTTFVQQVLAGVSGPMGSLMAPADAAFGIVAFYLGIELLTHLDGDRGPAESVLASAGQLAGLVGLVGEQPSRELPGPEVANREVGNREVANREVANREVANREVGNREVGNREVGNREVGNREADEAHHGEKGTMARGAGQ